MGASEKPLAFAFDHWHRRDTLMSVGPGDGCHKIVITCDSAEGANAIHDHIVQSFIADGPLLNESQVEVQVDGEYLSLHDEDGEMFAVLDKREARVLAAWLLKMADEIVEEEEPEDTGTTWTGGNDGGGPP